MQTAKQTRCHPNGT